MDNNYTIKEVIEQRFSEMGGHLLDIKEEIKEVKDKVAIQNGRVTKTEQWSHEAQKIIDRDSKIVSNYLINKKVIYSLISLLILIGSTIITLSVQAIDNKIEKGISKALTDKYNITNE